MKQAVTLKLYAPTCLQAKAYGFAALFVCGNVALPQLFHLFPQGGATWLPIYFFTLLGAYKWGWQVGALTALLSPVVNHFLFGMPPLAVLPAILTKSVLLAVAASCVARRSRSVSMPLLVLVVLLYQSVGTLAEWAYTGSLHLALQDFRLGIPGMLLQVFGGYGLLRLIASK